jgi:DNA-binding transcriptional LysR family regulator
LLFNRIAQGLLLTMVGENIVNYARRMEEVALAIEWVTIGGIQQLQGSVRISLIEVLGINWISINLLLFLLINIYYYAMS